MNRLDLDQVGILEGTDKSSSVSFGWDYLRHYEEWFAPWRDQSINIIEIGVANGRSLQMWKGFFTQAKIIGIDIDPDCSKFSDDRIAIEIGSQENPDFLCKVCGTYPPTIVIDDGSHQAHHIIYTFEQMFPLLNAGGAYVIEDLDLHFGADAGNWSPVAGYDAPRYLLDLAGACMTRKNREDLWGTRRSIVMNTDSVRFVNSGAMITKRQAEHRSANIEMALAYRKERSLDAQSLVRYASFLRDNGHDLHMIIDEMKNLSANEPGVDVEFFMVLAEFERDQGNTPDALKTLATGANVFPKSLEMLWRYGHWLSEYGEWREGLRVLGRALAACSDPGNADAIMSTMLRYSHHHQEVALAKYLFGKAADEVPNQECRAAILMRASEAV